MQGIARIVTVTAGSIIASATGLHAQVHIDAASGLITGSPEAIHRMALSRARSLKNIQLSPEQLDSIVAIDDTYLEQRMQINTESHDFHIIQKRMLVLREQERQDFRRVLTPTQQAIFDKNAIEARKIDEAQSKATIEWLEKKNT